MMRWLFHHWGWSLGGIALAAVLVLGVVLNPIGALGLLREIGGFFLDKLRGFVKWLRKKRTPVQRWRLACLVAGGLFSIAAFSAWDARRTVVVFQKEAATCKAGVVTLQQECDANIKAQRQQTRQVVAETNKEADRRVAAAEKRAKDATAAKAVSDARANELQREVDSFDSRLQQARRKPDCAALQDMNFDAICGVK